MRRSAPLEPLLTAAGVTVIVLGWVAVYFFVADSTERVHMLVAGAAVTAFLVYYAYGRRTIANRRLERLLKSRDPLTAVAFGERFFHDAPGGVECAAAIRRRLEEHIGLSLAGLCPDDQLQDINAELDPAFFELLGDDLGLVFPASDYRSYCEMLSRIKTVRVLVELALRCPKKKR